MLLLKCQLASDMGCIRTNNEDMILFNGGLYRDETYEQKFELIPQARFTAFVADGMGGHEGGEFASGYPGIRPFYYRSSFRSFP